MIFAPGVETLLSEIIIHIFSKLPLAVICSCRHVNKRLVVVGYPFVTYYIVVFDTSADMERLLAIFKSLVPSKEITIYHTLWKDLLTLSRLLLRDKFRINIIREESWN